MTHLYDSFKPDHYDLSLDINKEQRTFTGTARINGKKTGRPSNRITLHQRELKITKATVTNHTKSGDVELEVDRLIHHKSYDEIRVHTKNQIHSGNYTVYLEFTGKITGNMLGIYPSVFNHNGKEQTIIATQFESHHARAAFPCIDEPASKAVFDLTLTVPATDVVLSNTEVKNTAKNGAQQTVKFEPTPKMSTYLLAFVFGPLHCAEGTTKTGTSVKTWASIARPKKELEYSVKEAVKVLEFYEDYFKTPYPLAKCDQVALPDFDAGAMENWGLITYREIALLTDPDNRSISTEQYVSLVIAHELAHQWFGNLVTMKWWDDLWLNESFASLMEHLCLDKLHPDWHQWEIFTASDVLAATNRDIYKDVQSVGVTVKDPELIETLFDPGIVYAKGARLLKMLREYIGDEAFQTGLQNYFKKHAYANTSRDDLWEALSQSSKKDVKSLMTPWLEQSGLPIIRATQKGKELHLSQERYVLDSENDTQKWPVPLLANQKLDKDILLKQKSTFKSESTDFVILNQFASGHYFTHYTEESHRLYLAEQVATQGIPSETRMNILNDSLMLARGGETSLVDTLRLAMACDQEPRDSVWTLVLRGIGYAQQLTDGDDQTDAAIKVAKGKLASFWYNKLGWDSQPNDDPNTHQLRHTALALMIASEDSAAIDEALSLYSKDLAKIDAELRPSILATAVKHGDKSVVSDLVELYPKVGSDIQLDITSALTSTKDPATAKRIISKALGQNGFVRNQDLMRWVAMFVRNRYTREAMWEFIVHEWKWLEETLAGSKSFDYLPTYLASAMSSKDWQKKYHALFNEHESNKVLARNIQVGYADIAARVAWRERDEQAIKDFFKDQSKKK